MVHSRQPATRDAEYLPVKRELSAGLRVISLGSVLGKGASYSLSTGSSVTSKLTAGAGGLVPAAAWLSREAIQICPGGRKAQEKGGGVHNVL